MGRRRNKQTKQSQVRHLITQLNPRSPISEQYRTLRTNIEYSAVDQEIQTILVTSSSSSEGKSVTTANLASVYAQQGKKVLLIDADLRKPTVHYKFRLSNLRGLSNVLIGESSLEEVIESSDIDHLDIISSGPIPPNPSELLGSNRMKRLIKEARELYDVILFDMPPILPVTDAQILANFVDGSLLVIRSGQTEYELAMKAKETLQSAKAKLLGTVLNDCEKTDTNYYYYYGAN